MSNKVVAIKNSGYPTHKIRELADEFWAKGHKEISGKLHDLAREAEERGFRVGS